MSEDKTREEIKNQYATLKAEAEKRERAGYGWCPICGEDATVVQKLDGYTRCKNGHAYPHSERRYD